MSKVTKHLIPYPDGYSPDYINPVEYGKYRYALGKYGTDPLVVICMNPSAAKEDFSDMTINRIISISKKLNKNGWIIFNLYPERATKARNMEDKDIDIIENTIKYNIEFIHDYLLENKITEVWGAWGNDHSIPNLCKGKYSILNMFALNGIKVFYFGTLTNSGNPRHPLQRNERIDYTKKKYLDLDLYK